MKCKHAYKQSMPTFLANDVAILYNKHLYKTHI